jgi:hypothetical protein
MRMENVLAPKGSLTTRVIRASGPGLRWKLSNFPKMWPGLWREALAKVTKTPIIFGHLHARHIKVDGSVVNYGLVSTRLVTSAFVNFVVAQLQAETTEFGDYKYHDSGVGVTPAAIGDVDIETTDGEARIAGTQVEGASTNIYKSIGTIPYTTTKAITEHGLFSTLASTTLMDHHVFSAINVDNGDSIEFTYNITFPAET